MIDAGQADVDRPPGPGEWARLSRAPAKQDAFARDIYFREGWADFVELLGKDAVPALGSLALMTFKPEAVVGRRLTRSLEFVADHGFVPVASATVRYMRHSMRELWRYNWDVYTVDRLALATLMHGSSETLLWLLRRSGPPEPVPASVHLSDLKGSAARDERREDHLRAVLEPPNRIINFVHVADEPADVIRELAIFLERDSRRTLLREIRDRPTGDAYTRLAAQIRRLEAEQPAHDLDFTRSLRALKAAGRVDEGARARIDAAATSDAKLRWDELCALVDPADSKLSIWDFVCVACEVLPLERDGCEDLLPSAGPEEWEKPLAAALGSR